jgi:hypothetical protein
MIVIDEECGVNKALFDAADSLATNEDARVLAIGNPDDPSSHFAEVCKPGSGWNSIHIGYADTPNFTGEPVAPEVGKALISKVWVDERRSRWGEQSPVFISKVLGEFPADAQDAVVPGSWAFRCKNMPWEDPAVLPNEGGLDVGAGGDESVFMQRLGNKLIEHWSDRNPDTMATADRAHSTCMRLGIENLKIDTIGIGKGVADQLKRLAAGKYRITPVHVGEKSDNPARYPRLRDQLWWELGRELSEDGGWDLSAMSDDFIAQLTAPKYEYDSSRRIKVEPKEDTIARIGNSPDKADAALLAFYGGRTKKNWSVA